MSKPYFTVSHWFMGRDEPNHYLVRNKEAFEALGVSGQKGTTDEQIHRGVRERLLKSIPDPYHPGE